MANPVPAYLAQFAQWMANANTFLFGRWEGFPEGGYEGGVDLAAPENTPVYALATGPLQGAGYFCHGGPFQNTSAACSNNNPGYGVLTQRVNVPGYGVNDLYYQHITLAPGIQTCGNGNCGGQIIQKGQLIGYITPGVNMLEMGFNANWGTIWGGSHPAAWVTDPRPLLKNLVNAFTGGSPLTSTSPTSGAGSISGAPSSGGNTTYPSSCPPWDLACSAASFFSSNTVRQVGLLFIALILLLVGLQVLFFGKGDKES